MDGIDQLITAEINALVAGGREDVTKRDAGKSLLKKLKNEHLFLRILIAKKCFEPVVSKYRIVYEDPADPDEPCRIVAPDPNWLASALEGGVLPDIQPYIDDKDTERNWYQEMAELGFANVNTNFFWSAVGGAKHPYAEPIDPMTEEEAIEYLLMKDVPLHVWRDYEGNREIFKMVPVEMVPKETTFRDAWQIKQENIDEHITN